MQSQPSNERKSQSPPTQVYARVNTQRTANWLPSLSNAPLSRTQSFSTISSKGSIDANVSDGAAIKKSKSSKVLQTLNSMSARFLAPSSRTSTTHASRSISSTASETSLDYRQPKPNIFATIPLPPGVCSSLTVSNTDLLIFRFSPSVLFLVHRHSPSP